MTKLRKKSEIIRSFILEHVDNHPNDIGRRVAEYFNLSRQAVHKHLQKLIKENALIVSGQTRNKTYKLGLALDWSRTYEITPDLAEDLIWRKDIRSILGKMPENVIELWHYGFTEMFNNALDHSEGSTVTVVIKKTAINTEMFILDDGVGIFKKIQHTLNLLDERHALFELSKGKLTTDPKRHSGEGIFFTSRMFDAYDIISGGVHFTHKFAQSEDWVFETDQSGGTFIRMKLANHVLRTTKKIFDEYTTGNDYGFNKTVVPVQLAQYEHDLLISRSQAKRLLARVQLFKIVIFDFTDVVSIGQAFADEIFRVFALQNPTIKLIVSHANAEVTQMINRAQANL